MTWDVVLNTPTTCYGEKTSFHDAKVNTPFRDKP